MRATLALLLLLAPALAGCAQGSQPEGPQDRAWSWLLGQRDEGSRWQDLTVPSLVESAVASGKDPAAWPEPVPLAGQLRWPPDGEGYMDSLRPLHAWALLPGHGGRGDAVTQRLLAGYTSGQFGQPGQLNDDAFALLALAAIDRAQASARAGSLSGNQSTAGGWSWAVGAAPETDMTGMAIMALARAGAAGFDAAAARAYLDRTHAAGGGHGYHEGEGPNCDSTVWAIRGYEALGVAPPPDDRAFLRSLQRDDGSVAYRPGGVGNLLCTVEAVPELG